MQAAAASLQPHLCDFAVHQRDGAECQGHTLEALHDLGLGQRARAAPPRARQLAPQVLLACVCVCGGVGGCLLSAVLASLRE